MNSTDNPALDRHLDQEEEGMNDSELALLMLEWEKKQREADAMAEKIKHEVEQRGKTFTAGSVTATPKAGRKTYNYKDSALNHLKRSSWDDNTCAQTINDFSQEEVVTDWKALCEAIAIPPEFMVFKQGKPSVTLKIK